MRRPRVLIVEDETITAHHLRQILTRLGYEVAGVAGDGNVALDLIAETTPDLLLADVGLAGDMDGVDVASCARERWKVPTVFLTAYSDAATLRRARVSEPYGYLVKPFAEQELHATIEIALRHRELAASREQQAQAAAQTLGRTLEDLNAVTRRLFSAQEQERERIARDLHDDISQQVALLQMDLEKIWRKLPPVTRNTMQSDFDAVLGRVAELSKDVRNLSHRLHPQILDHLGLEAALRDLCETFEERYSIRTRFSARDVPAHVPVRAAIALYRIVQESLRNIAKHAGADVVNVALVSCATHIELSVRDNGIGFDAGVQKRGMGLGLISMEQRARLAGGNFEIQSHPDRGTRIHVRFPVEAEELEKAESASA